MQSNNANKKTRDDFSSQTKRILCNNVGCKCSNPSCRKETIGPNEKSKSNTSIGIAAHICAASKGGPRYDENMSQEERRNTNNGIWLCNVCAKLIDSNPQKYTVQLLRKWKADAEYEQSLKIGLESESKTDKSNKDDKMEIINLNKVVFELDQILKLANELYEMNFLGKDELCIENELEDYRNLYEHDIVILAKYPSVRDQIFDLRKNSGLLFGLNVEEKFCQLFKRLEFQFISGAFGAETYLSNFMICVYNNYSAINEIIKSIKIELFRRYNELVDNNK